MAQFMRPISDITNNWASGDWQDLDDNTDTEFTYSADNADVTCEHRLTDLSGTTPSSGTCTVRVRHSESDGGVAQSSGGSTASFTIEVFQNTTSIAGPTSSINAAESAWTTDSSLTFNTSAVSDWSNLRIRLVITGGGGSPTNRRGMACAWMEIETPDASSDTDITTNTPPGMTTTTYSPSIDYDLRPGSVSMTTTTYTASISTQSDTEITTNAPPAMTSTTYAPSIDYDLRPGSATLTTTTYAPSVDYDLRPGVASLTTTTYAASIDYDLRPGTAALTTTTYAPGIDYDLRPGVASMTVTTYPQTVDDGIAAPAPDTTASSHYGRGPLRRLGRY